MSRRARKVVSVLSLLVLVLNVFSAPAVAVEDQTKSLDLVATKTAAAIRDHLHHLDTLGIEELNLEDVYLSEGIQAYEAVDGNAVPLDTVYYPVLSEGEVVAISMAYEHAGELFVQITSSLVGEISAFYQNNESAALVFDSSSVYATDGEHLTKISDSGYESNWRDTITGGLSLANVTCSALVAAERIVFGIITRDAPVYKDLNVPYEQNYGEEGVCWASCVSSVGKYLTGTYYTGAYIARQHTGGLNGGDVYDIQACLENFYGLEYNVDLVASINYFDDIVDNIWAGYPVIVWVNTYGNSPSYNHGIVVCGFYTNDVTKYCTVMDPNISTRQYANVLSTGGILYVDPTSSNGRQGNVVSAVSYI